MLDQLPPGVDETQLDENLKLTPTERLEKMLRFLRFIDRVTGGRTKEYLELETIRSLRRR